MSIGGALLELLRIFAIYIGIPLLKRILDLDHTDPELAASLRMLIADYDANRTTAGRWQLARRLNALQNSKK